MRAALAVVVPPLSFGAIAPANKHRRATGLTDALKPEARYADVRSMRLHRASWASTSVPVPPVVAAALLLFAAPAQAVDDASLERHIRGIERPGPPQIVRRNLLLTFASELPIRFVGARFEHERFTNLRLYSRNEHGVFVLPLPLAEDLTAVRYRIVVDGLWQADPNNAMTLVDESGVSFSVFPIPAPTARSLAAPRSNADGTVTFQLRASPGKRVTIVGNFTAWDPFLYPMAEEQSGNYTTTLRVPTGRLYYYFALDGGRLLDPLNINTARTAGIAVSTYLHAAQD